MAVGACTHHQNTPAPIFKVYNEHACTIARNMINGYSPTEGLSIARIANLAPVTLISLIEGSL